MCGAGVVVAALGIAGQGCRVPHHHQNIPSSILRTSGLDAIGDHVEACRRLKVGLSGPKKGQHLAHRRRVAEVQQNDANIVAPRLIRVECEG